MPNNRSHVSGHTWLEYSGVPPNNVGHRDQYCRNILTGDIYQKKSATLWELCGDLTNSHTSFGVIIPANTLGKVGDIYINYVSLTMYEKTAATVWTPRCKVASL
jgi:hypothetical protein